MNTQRPTTTKKTLSHSWTTEKLALQDRKSVELIKERALKQGAADLVALCNNDLESRVSQKKARSTSQDLRRLESDFVVWYHFVCERGRGVTEATEGRFWSGSWVVAEVNVRKSIEQGAYLALHETKKDLSYRQGAVVDYRRSPRDMVPESETGAPPQIEEGIEFLVQETSHPYRWVGGGAGEKGYRWANQDTASNATVQDGGLSS